jgi:hypothetical protein
MSGLMITLARAHQLGIGRRWVVKQVQQKVGVLGCHCDEAFAVDHFIGLSSGLHQKLVQRCTDQIGSRSRSSTAGARGP